MAIKITKKIKGYSVGKPDDGTIPTVGPDPRDAIEVPPKAEVIQMHEKVERPDMLVGSTYKIKSPLFEHALYVTINDIVLNEGTEHELRRPFEIFINSKNMDHFQWIVALTRIMSAVFRKGGDVTFIVEELKAVFDPRGGYFKAGGVYMPSIVAELGAIVEQHLKMIGLLHDPELDPEQRRLIAEKRAAYEARAAGNDAKKKPELSVESKAEAKPAAPQDLSADLAGVGGESARKTAEIELVEPTASGFPAGATLCNKCNTQAVILMDGCATCLNCGYSKCG
ncbi:MAG: NrdJb [Rudaea sp.]|uniref:TSCPD domain-containing protein n=1 Tax=unclassified Rudaea TaxID=2627037 RepID=UPI0010F80D06|nr:MULTISPECIES: NrdJb [unclassified Rudaea]MBN8885573.1 NrdJb [Rudaea sp.]MBR0347751.1 NrdJb [Rudaea sp.]